MTARQQSLLAKVPRYAALYFPEENTTGIGPVSIIQTGLIEKDRTVQCEWNGSTVSAKIVLLSESRAELTRAIDVYEPETPEPEVTPAPQQPQPTGSARNNRKAGKQEGPTAKHLASGDAARSVVPLPSTTAYERYMDEDVTATIEVLTQGKSCKTTQTITTGMVNNGTQTDPDPHMTVLQEILRKISALERRINSNDMENMERRISEKIELVERKVSSCVSGSVRPRTSTMSQSDSFLDDLYTFEDENNSTLQSVETTPRPKSKTRVADLGFWKLTPSEILGIDTPTVIETAAKKTPMSQTQLTPELTERLKCESLNQRTLFVRNLLYVLCSIEDLYMKNVNGRVSHGVTKGRINPDKINVIKTEVFRFFPCLPSEEKKIWSECVRAMDKANIYVFRVINKKFDISEIAGYNGSN